MISVHAFPKGICAKWNANNLNLNLKSRYWFHFYDYNRNVNSVSLINNVLEYSIPLNFPIPSMYQPTVVALGGLWHEINF